MSYQQRGGRGRGNIRGHTAVPSSADHGGGNHVQASAGPAEERLLLPLDPHHANQMWVDRLRQAFTNGDSLTHLLQEAFRSTRQPFMRALDLVIFSPDYRRNRPDGAAATVLNQFRTFVCEMYGSARCAPSTVLNTRTKWLAFKALYNQESAAVADAIVDLFDLAGSQLFVNEIQDLISSRDHKKASQLASRLGLQSSLNVESVVVPLVLQDRPNLVENLLANAPAEQQKAGIRAIDKLLEKGLNAAASEHGMISYAKEKVNQKSLKKLVERLCKQFQLSIYQAAPKAALATGRAQLNFIMYRRFREGSVTPDDCYNFLIDILAAFPDLVIETLDRLCAENAYRTAIDVARLLEVSHREMPLSMMHVMHELRREPRQDEDQWAQRSRAPSSSDQFYQMPSHVRVELVDSMAELPDICRFLENYDGPLGMDTEWKPLVVPERFTGCSLLQVSTNQVVYVFDLLALDEKSPQMSRLGSAILARDNLKLGYDTTSDFEMLEESVPAFENAILARKNMFDMKLLSSRVEAGYSEAFPFRESSSAHQNDTGGAERAGSKEGHKGLSELVRKCFGRPLNKEEQCSYWELRPLRPTQLQYAATDAYCLIAVYSRLSEQLLNLFNTTPRQVLHCIITSAASKGATAGPSQFSGGSRKGGAIASNPAPPEKPRKKKAPASRKELANPPPPNSRAIKPDQFRVVCDTMVQGLGKKLRSIGADTVILDNGVDHDECVKLSRSERRVILTRGRELHRRMSGLVAAGHCYRVLTERAADQLDEVVRHFKLDVAPDDLFKRCQHCNSGDYWHVPSSVIRHVRDRDNSGWLRLERDGPAQVFSRTGQVRDCDVIIQTENVRDSTLASVDTFYVCQACGHVYWAGSHHGRFMAGLGDIVRPQQQSKSIFPAEEVAAQLGHLRVIADSDSDSDDCYY